MEILEMEPATTDVPDAKSARRVNGEIIFEDVSFSYKSGQLALDGVTFLLPGNQTTAIVGHSGSGKSTIAKLLTRLYEPDEGQIYLDYSPLQDYRVKSLRRHITLLSQESSLSRRTILENISFGKPDATIEEVRVAARKAGAHDFIEALPEGYDTLVGEAGQTLSGGERQRIAFARAALRDSRIMIFDEPAAGLDPMAERVVRETITTLKESRTVLMITHRLNLVDLSDWVILLENGEVVEQGIPKELLGFDGKYSAMYREWLSQHSRANLPKLPAVLG